MIEGRFVDGGEGSYADPSYLAACELLFWMVWDPTRPHTIQLNDANRFWAWQWIEPLLGAVLIS